MLAPLLLALALAAPASDPDTVLLVDGGRLRGTVIEESATNGVTVQLPDGTTRHLELKQVFRIQYADGTVSLPGQPRPPAGAVPPPASAPPAAVPPPPPATPAPPPPWSTAVAPPARGPAVAPVEAGEEELAPVARPAGVPVYPLWLAFGIGGAGASGHAAPGLSMSDLTSGQLDLLLEGGARFAERFYLGLYLDIGVGDAAGWAKAACRLEGHDTCTSSRAALGLTTRLAFAPRERWNPWVGLGIGAEATGVASSDSEVITYVGGEWPRLSAGLDFRGNAGLGVGLYANLAFVRYSQVSGAATGWSGNHDLASRSTHTWLGIGARFILFP